MKKYFRLLLLLCVVLVITACAKTETTELQTNTKDETVEVNTSSQDNNTKENTNTNSSSTQSASESFYSQAKHYGLNSPAEIGEVAKLNYTHRDFSDPVPVAVRVVKGLSETQVKEIAALWGESSYCMQDLSDTETSKWVGGAVIEVDYGEFTIPTDALMTKWGGYSALALKPMGYNLISLDPDKDGSFLKDSARRIMWSEIVPIDENYIQGGEKVGIKQYVVIYQLPNDYKEDYVVLYMGDDDFDRVPEGASYIKLPTN